MRDEDREPDERLEAAKAAAPYIHPRLASIEHSGPNGGPIETESTSVTAEMTPQQAAEAYARLRGRG